MRICHVVQRSAQIYPHCPFLVTIENGNQSLLTYSDAPHIMISYKRWIEDIVIKRLYDSPQMHRDMHVVVAFLSHNSPDLLLAMMGGMNLKRVETETETNEVKVTSAMLNVRWTGNEIAKALAVQSNESAAQHLTLIIHSRGLEAVAKEASRIINMEQLQTDNHSCYHYPLLPMNSIPEILFTESKEDHAHDRDNSGMNEDAILLFTSGTTSGISKGVRLSNMSLLIQAMAKTTSPCFYDSSTQMLATAVPFFHIGGISSALAIILSGGMLVFPHTKSVQGFSPPLLLKSMQQGNEVRTEFDVNTLVVVPAMLHAIFCEIAKFETETNQIVYSHVRLLLVGGQSITTPQLHKCKKYFPRARIVQTYACTEAGSSITFATIFNPNSSRKSVDSNSDQPNLDGCAGFPPHHVDLKIFRLDARNKPTNEAADEREIGAIGTRGPHVMNGYWKRGQSTCTGDQRNQWLIMNDLGYIDESGQLFFCGRSSDVIRTGGETVFAPEVESVVIQHPAINQCAIFALPDEKFGESVSAAVILDDLTENKSYPEVIESSDLLHEIRSFCSQNHLASYKRPRSVFLCNELPCNSSGKVLKHILLKHCLQARKKESKL